MQKAIQTAFSAVTCDDIPILNFYLRKKNIGICDYTSGSVIMWKDFYNTSYCIINDSLVLKTSDNGIDRYSMPIGDSDICETLREIRHLALIDKNSRLNFTPVTEEFLPYFIEVFGEDIDIKSSQNWSDYIYSANDLQNFAGKKYHTQKNHLNKFYSNYPSAEFVKIDKSNLHILKEFWDNYKLEHPPINDTGIFEQGAADKLIERFFCIEACGGMMLVDGNPIAFAIGEVLGNTLFTHVEKADTSYQGAYQAIVRAFTREFATFDQSSENNESQESKTGVYIVNREEDDGIEGLRKSKMAYRPIDLLKKYFISVDLEK